MKRQMILGLTLMVIIGVIVGCNKRENTSVQGEGSKANNIKIQYNPESDFEAEPIDGGKSVKITKYIGDKWEVGIPQKIQNLPVTHIGGGAFRNKNLINITIPEGVLEIGQNAFSDNKLTSINIPDSVTSIGDDAFADNNLTSIIIGNSVTSIGNRAFFYSPHLTSITVNTQNSMYSSLDGVLFNKDRTVLIAYPFGKQGSSYTIPSGVTSIKEHAFGSYWHGGSENLTHITIPSSVTIIESGAFCNCSNLININIPTSVIELEQFTFYGCYALLPEINEEIVRRFGDRPFWGQ